jgi:hypothetical protein
MIGRFLRSYSGYTAETALAMPWPRFMALLNAIPGLEAEQDLRALMVAAVGANPGDKGKGFKDYSKQLQTLAGVSNVPRHVKDTVAPGLTPGVEVLSDGDAILTELRAKRAAWAAEHPGKGVT